MARISNKASKQDHMKRFIDTDKWYKHKKVQLTLPSLDDVTLDKTESVELLRRLKLKLKGGSK